MNEDPQEFLDCVYNVLSAMEDTSREKAEVSSYQLRHVYQIFYIKWKDNRPIVLGPIELEEFKEDFCCIYFHR